MKNKITAIRTWFLVKDDKTPKWVKSASIVEMTNELFYIAVDAYGSKTDTCSSLVAAKRIFGRYYYTGAKWKLV